MDWPWMLLIISIFPTSPYCCWYYILLELLRLFCNMILQAPNLSCAFLQCFSGSLWLDDKCILISINAWGMGEGFLWQPHCSCYSWKVTTSERETFVMLSTWSVSLHNQWVFSSLYKICFCVHVSKFPHCLPIVSWLWYWGCIMMEDSVFELGYLPHPF